ncbi:hypothetical protein [Flexibacterium corallicola]|uniref:hypothetical protein n=1 Tax=Flexibacterium corallicola TaxID=3037259 RepID=UPI00286ECA98|nr:hypothetical protein [Pseudovibrio sp. M1P-2-3]
MTKSPRGSMVLAMTVTVLRTSELAARLSEVSCLEDQTGLPRYWATVWTACCGAHLQAATIRKHLSRSLPLRPPAMRRRLP